LRFTVIAGIHVSDTHVVYTYRVVAIVRYHVAVVTCCASAITYLNAAMYTHVAAVHRIVVMPGIHVHLCYITYICAATILFLVYAVHRCWCATGCVHCSYVVYIHVADVDATVGSIGCTICDIGVVDIYKVNVYTGVGIFAIHLVYCDGFVSNVGVIPVRYADGYSAYFWVCFLIVVCVRYHMSCVRCCIPATNNRVLCCCVLYAGMIMSF